MRRCIASERGTAAIEYALLLALLALVVTGALREIQSDLNTLQTTEQALAGGLRVTVSDDHPSGTNAINEGCANPDQQSAGRHPKWDCSGRGDGSGGGT